MPGPFPLFVSNSASIVLPSYGKARSNGLSGSIGASTDKWEFSWLPVAGGIPDLEPGTPAIGRCVGRPDDAPAALPAAEEVKLMHLDPGNAVLAQEHAGAVQHLQRLGHRAAGALGLSGDRLVARKTAAGAGIVKAPQQHLPDVQVGASRARGQIGGQHAAQPSIRVKAAPQRPSLGSL
jgi:hypothetical protein